MDDFVKAMLDGRDDHQCIADMSLCLLAVESLKSHGLIEGEFVIHRLKFETLLLELRCNGIRPTVAGAKGAILAVSEMFCEEHVRPQFSLLVEAQLDGRIKEGRANVD